MAKLPTLRTRHRWRIARTSGSGPDSSVGWSIWPQQGSGDRGRKPPAHTLPTTVPEDRYVQSSVVHIWPCAVSTTRNYSRFDTWFQADAAHANCPRDHAPHQTVNIRISMQPQSQCTFGFFDSRKLAYAGSPLRDPVRIAAICTSV